MTWHKDNFTFTFYCIYLESMEGYVMVMIVMKDDDETPKNLDAIDGIRSGIRKCTFLHHGHWCR
jgi:hypothetical protein